VRNFDPLRTLLHRAPLPPAKTQSTFPSTDDSPPTLADADLCWIFGTGRSGSTWLLELLNDLGGTLTWHEPYFGVIFRPLQNNADAFNRPDGFFANAYRPVWMAGIRRLFLQVAEARFGTLPAGTKLIIKDINAPELCPFFAEVFPQSRYLLLLRDPFDILDSYIDMQRPGGWNEAFGASFGPERSAARIEGTARHIRTVYATAITGYDGVQPDLRMQLRYEDMLERPLESLETCVKFLGLSVSQSQLQRSVEAHRFEKHKETGQTAFRRFGKAGIWQSSGNFTPEVTQIATEVLGDLRQRLGYTT
jgi:hypothetical protein